MADDILHLKMRGESYTYCFLEVDKVKQDELFYSEGVNCQVCLDGLLDYCFRLRMMPRSDRRRTIDVLSGAGYALIATPLALLLLLGVIDGYYMLALMPWIGGPVSWMVAVSLPQRQNKKRLATWACLIGYHEGLPVDNRVKDERYTMADDTLHMKMAGDAHTYCFLDGDAVEHTDGFYYKAVNCEVCWDSYADFFLRMRMMPRFDWRRLVDGLFGASLALIAMGFALAALLYWDVIDGHFMLASPLVLGGGGVFTVAHFIQEWQDKKWLAWSIRQWRIVCEGRARIREEQNQRDGG